MNDGTNMNTHGDRSEDSARMVRQHHIGLCTMMHKPDWCAVHAGGLGDSASDERGTHTMIDPVKIGEW